MKTMICRELAGACDTEFHAEIFDEIGEMSKKSLMLWLKISNYLKNEEPRVVTATHS